MKFRNKRFFDKMKKHLPFLLHQLNQTKISTFAHPSPPNLPLIMNFTTSYTSSFSLTPRGFTGHEHYPEFNIINMNGRLYDPVIGRFFSPDNFVQTPEFTQGFNRYSYCLNNPLKYTDPSGELWDEWNFNKETGIFTWVSDRGRDDCVDYYNVFERTASGEMEHTYTKILDRTTDALINSFRISETENSTISAFHIPDTEQSGFFLEPKGPSTTVANQNQRIPEGTYNVENYSSTKFSNVFRVYNENVSQDRKILIHIGNTHKNTSGCLLPGTTKRTDYVGKSEDKLNEIRSFYNGRDLSTARLMIYNLILQP